MGGRGMRNPTKTGFWLYPVGVKSLKEQSRLIVAHLVLCMGAMIAGCEAPSITRGGFKSGSPAARTHAIEVTINEADSTGRISRDNVKSMVELLNADDDLVRFMAISALSKVSGDDLGYRFFDPQALRFRSVEKWRTYALQGNGSKEISIEPPFVEVVESGVGS